MMQEPTLDEWCEDLKLSRMQMELWRAVVSYYPTCDNIMEWSMAEDRVKTLERYVKEAAQA